MALMATVTPDWVLVAVGDQKVDICNNRARSDDDCFTDGWLPNHQDCTNEPGKSLRSGGIWSKTSWQKAGTVTKAAVKVAIRAPAEVTGRCVSMFSPSENTPCLDTRARILHFIEKRNR